MMRSLNLTNAARAIWLVVRSAAPVALGALLLLAPAHWAFERWPERTQAFSSLMGDHFFVVEQIRRSHTIPKPDVVFVGDSTCLMGIDAKALGDLLGRSVESLCNVGYVGPVGYGHLLANLAARGALPGTVIVAVSPAQFPRHPSWDEWTALVKNNGPIFAPKAFPESALRFIQHELFSRAVYTSLPTYYGRYYGSADGIMAAIRSTNGSAIDPYLGLNVGSMSKMPPVGSPSLGTVNAIDFTPNENFLKAMSTLGEVIRALPSTNVFLTITPAPELMVSVAGLQERAFVLAALAERIGAKPLLARETLPGPFFATGFHLSRWGQAAYTQALASVIGTVIADAPKSSSRDR